MVALIPILFFLGSYIVVDADRVSNTTWRQESTAAMSYGNPIDDCRRLGGEDRQHLANCALGYGSRALGGYGGAFYVVVDPSDDPLHPAQGTLRHAVIQEEPLWIYFATDMNIRLADELVINSFKTIDGRGANVEISHGACLTLFHAKHVIVHGLKIHHCVPTAGGWITTRPEHLSHRGAADGDGLRVYQSHDVWIDHNTFSHCSDGLLDVIHGSGAVTISNNHFHDHDKVMLLGHADDSELDYDMKITVAFNRFGPRCVQRMPRCRFGYFHVVNNDYHSWEMYAIGGSANPTILSQGNRFIASDNPKAKEITKRVGHAGEWRSVDDLYLNGAYFVELGQGDPSPGYTSTENFVIGQASQVAQMTAQAGALSCLPSSDC